MKKKILHAVRRGWRSQLYSPIFREDWLLLSSLFASGLLILRILTTNENTYLFLLWNLALAFVPLICTWFFLQADPRKRWLKATWFMLWLLFLPNSFYLFTDLFHFREVRSAPGWFDLVLLLSFAWSGLQAGMFSLQRIESWLRSQGWLRRPAVFIFPVLFLCALGVYLGRYRRFNSWDIFTDPFALTDHLLELVFQPLGHTESWAMIISYALFIWLIYQGSKPRTLKMH
ncbi:DUF1361 domain-containing protein [Terrimonas ferruginea]|uniref:DUF1361 domain-containing protein n=1 Tax=Terrimonas ferruginea TaxID=249 RepID=UPI000417D29B|nr:DUF1361 domain-containing protein [Terrimonas ferruginea]